MMEGLGATQYMKGKKERKRVTKGKIWKKKRRKRKKGMQEE